MPCKRTPCDQQTRQRGPYSSRPVAGVVYPGPGEYSNA
jgi:hypothetical protein